MQRIVLVAEDDPSIQMLVSGIFEMRGYRVLKAYTGSEATVIAVDARPDLIVSDLNMPSGYGSSFFKRVREDEATKHIPFIFITGLPEDQARKLIPENTPNTLLIRKPFDVKELLNAAEQILAP